MTSLLGSLFQSIRAITEKGPRWASTVHRSLLEGTMRRSQHGEPKFTCSFCTDPTVGCCWRNYSKNMNSSEYWKHNMIVKYYYSIRGNRRMSVACEVKVASAQWQISVEFSSPLWMQMHICCSNGAPTGSFFPTLWLSPPQPLSSPKGLSGFFCFRNQ